MRRRIQAMSLSPVPEQQSTQLRVLHVVPSLDQEMGGLPQAALLMNDVLTSMGVASSIVATHVPSDRLDYLGQEFPAVSYELFRRRFPGHYYRAPGLRKRLHRSGGRIDVLHVHGVFNFPAAYGLVAARSAGVVGILSPHGQLDPYDLRRHCLSKSVYGQVFLRRVLPSIRAAVVTSDREGMHLRTYGVSLAARTIGLPVRAPSGGDGSRLREHFGIPPDGVVTLFLGRIHPKKRLDILLESVAKARGRVPDLCALVVGDGDPHYVRELQELSVRLGADSFTTWAGTLRGQDKADAFAAGDIFALPSENENFGITVVEALLAGVPAVVSDNVYLHEILSDKDLALVCDTTVESCSSALVSLARDPTALRARSGRVRDVAAALFAPDRVGQRLAETYLAALGRRP